MPSRSDIDAENGPMVKRQKVDSVPYQSSASKIFAPYRTLGLVSPTAVPFTSIPLGKTTFQITTSVGRCLHTYDLRRGLNLVFITRPQTPTVITATCAWKDRVFASWGGDTIGSEVGLWAFKRGKQVGELEIPVGLTESVKQIVIFGSWIVACCSSRIEVWKSRSYEHYTTLTPTKSRDDHGDHVLSGVVCNMPTLLNKILVGRQNGSVELWNLSTNKLIYTFSPPGLETGPVTALQPAPALSLLAIARANGSIIIHDIRADKEIIRLNSKSPYSASITSISFRTDGMGSGEDGQKSGVMATAGLDDGEVTLWDLNEGGRIMGILRNAHSPPSISGSGVSAGISRVEFLPSQPVMVTSGCDNALKSWIFDETPYSPIPRILHTRGGHAAPITRMDFLPDDADGADAIGKWLMSAGRDQSLWAWSLRRDGQSSELSQGNIRKKARKLGIMGKGLDLDSSTKLEDLKAPEITCMSCSLNRDGGMGASTGGGTVWANVTSKKGGTKGADNPDSGWESIVTGHKGDKFARTWFWGRKKAGRWAFETGDGTEVKSVAMTSCGTFALIGSAGGGIDVFNLQSGIHRKRFPSPLTPAQARQRKLKQLAQENDDIASTSSEKFGPGEGRHTKDVTGIMVDPINRTVYSCSLDGKIKFWDFLTGILLHEIDWSQTTAITGARYYRSSDLLALSCDDLAIRIIDTETRKLVRELWGCVGQISDFCFSNDGRWIIAASMDSVIRVWDLPTGHLIDAMRIDGICTALAFSTSGEFLATAHADSIGINIWTNRTLFTHVPTRLIREDEISQAVLPTASGEGNHGLIASAFEDDTPEIDSSSVLAPKTDQLSAQMTTLSLVPRSRWQTLLHLDTIALRNKPKEAAKAPEKAPFFLPSLEKPNPTLSSPLAIETPNPPLGPRSRISKLDPTSTSNTSPFTTLLHTAKTTNIYDPFLTHLTSLSPSVADLEIRSLSPVSRSFLSSPASEATTAPINELATFIHALTSRLRERRDYELVQTWMAVFLRVHGALVIGDQELIAALREWRDVQAVEGRRLADLVGYCQGVLGFLSSGR